MPGIIPALQTWKASGFLLIVITNQGGIAKGIYSEANMHQCHDHFQSLSGQLIDAFYHAPGHPDISATLSRKPGSLLFEKAIAKYGIDPGRSWMIGNSERDLIPAKKLGICTIMFQGVDSPYADYSIQTLEQAHHIISGQAI